MKPILNTEFPEFNEAGKENAYHDGGFKSISKKDMLGHWSLVVFYPGDFTFVCPTELEDLAEKYEEFKKIGVEVYSCSCDTHFVHKAWADASSAIKKVKYPMLADPTGQLANELGILIPEDQMAYRGSFVVNPEGVIKIVELNDNSVGRDAEEILRKIKAAQFVASHDGQVCPAKWREGQDTLKPSIDLVGKI